MEWLFPWLLLLHVLGAIIAFGPSFTNPLIGAMGGREPQHANFGTRIMQRVSERIVIPVALTMPVTGVAMILVAGINLGARENWWLGLAIVLYVVTISFAWFVQLRNVRRVAELSAGGPPPGAGGPGGPRPGAGGPPPGAGGPAAAGPAAAGPGPGAGAPPPGAGGPPPGAGGPPPELRATIQRVQRGGMFLGLMIVLIVSLMVLKPQF